MSSCFVINNNMFPHIKLNIKWSQDKIETTQIMLAFVCIQICMWGSIRLQWNPITHAWLFHISLMSKIEMLTEDCCSISQTYFSLPVDFLLSATSHRCKINIHAVCKCAWMCLGDLTSILRRLNAHCWDY